MSALICMNYKVYFIIIVIASSSSKIIVYLKLLFCFRLLLFPTALCAGCVHPGGTGHLLPDASLCQSCTQRDDFQAEHDREPWQHQHQAPVLPCRGAPYQPHPVSGEFTHTHTAV